MLIIISPAKTLDFSLNKEIHYTLPSFLKESEMLVQELKKYNPDDISELMHVSRHIALLNYDRYMKWNLPFTTTNAKQALFAFKGDVYRSMCVDTFNDTDTAFAQKHLRILSGLYGVLRPLDLIQPYRLEMGTKISTEKYKNLYHFWNDKITSHILKYLKELKSNTIINLASAEYFKSIKLSGNRIRVITPEFREERNGRFVTISIYAKMARGLMTQFIIKNHLDDPQQIKLFDIDGYQFNSHLSNECKWFFTR